MSPFFVPNDYFKEYLIEFESESNLLEESTVVKLSGNKSFKVRIRTKYEHNLREGHRPSFKVVDGNKYVHDGMKGITVYFNDDKGNIKAYPAEGKDIEGKENREFLDYLIKTNYDDLNKIWKTRPNSEEYNRIMENIQKNTGNKFNRNRIRFINDNKEDE